MPLKEDVKKVFIEIFGLKIAEQLDSFEDPEKYPDEFLKECVFFLGKLIGDEQAIARFQPIFKKYGLKLEGIRT